MYKHTEFLYHCLKPNTIVDIYTTNPSIAEELSHQGCRTKCVMISSMRGEIKDV